MQNHFLTVLLSFTLLFSTCLDAQIYKYKDKHGKWHFSDKPITQQQKKASQAPAKNTAPVKIIYQDPSSPYAVEPPKASQHTSRENDLGSQLIERFRPTSTVEKVTLAVVTVETSLSVGSGFFISEDGFLLTNKHVIRPGEGEKFEAQKEEFAKLRVKLDKQKDWLDNEIIRLQNYRIELDEYADRIRQASNGSRKSTAAADYEILSSRYAEMKAQHDRIALEHRSASKQLDDAESQFRLKSSAAQLEQRFKISLKDGTELRAELVAISRDYDLALLKLNGYKTPMINLQKQIPSQGQPVFAVGSPLGIRDSVTSGIVTRSDNKAIMTDAQILPGNSGGPLITADGEVVGINTLKIFHKDIQGEGFGVAIPLIKAYETFTSDMP